MSIRLLLARETLSEYILMLLEGAGEDSSLRRMIQDLEVIVDAARYSVTNFR